MMDRSRRTFLKTLGAAGAGYPFLRLLESSVTQAAADAVPLRLLVIATPHGCPYEFWRPRAPGNNTPGSGTVSNFDLEFNNSVLAPIAKYKSRINILDGVDYVSSIRTAQSGHQGYGSVLTGDIQPNETTFPTTPSLDQFLGLQPQVGGQTTFRSLELSVGGNKYPSRVLSWGQNGSILPRLLNPYATFKTVFGNFMRPDTGGTPNPGPDPALVSKLAQQKAVLKYTQADLKRLQSRLGPIEKQKLEQHLQAMRDLEQRLTGTGGASPTMSCDPPLALPDSPSWEGLYAENPNNSCYFNSQRYGSFMFDHVQQWSDLQVQMVSQAFACDLTRIITLQYFEAGSDGLAPWALPSVSSSDPLADPHVAGHQYSYNSGNAISLRLAEYQRWFTVQVVKLMDQLDAIPEGDGTVLDHTLIWWTNEFGGSNHFYNDVPMVLAGTANGKFKTGRYLVYGREPTPNCPSGGSDCFVPHNKLLVSIANAFPGVNLDSYGNTSSYNWGTGSLPML